MEDYWGIIYAIMKSLGINELEIEERYLEIVNDKRLKELKSSSECCKVKSIITKEQFSQIKYRIGE